MIQLLIKDVSVNSSTHTEFPKYLRTLTKLQKADGLKPQHCRKLRFAYDFGKLDHATHGKLRLKDPNGVVFVEFQVVDYEAEIRSLRQEIETLSTADPRTKATDFARLHERIFKLPKSLQTRNDVMEIIALANAGAYLKRFITLRLINRIKNYYDATNQPEEAAEFMNLLKQVVYPRKLLPHGYKMTNQLQQTDPEDVKAVIDEVLNLIQDMGYACFVNSGTLLGIVREGGFIKHDDDIDIALILKANCIPDLVREWLGICELLMQFGLRRRTDTKHVYFIKIRNRLAINFDVFPAWFNEDDIFSVYPHSFENLTRSDIFPLKKDAAMGFPIPNNSEKMLASNYGEDWQTPDPFFIYKWKQGMTNFGKYIREVDHQTSKIVVSFGIFDQLNARDQQFLKMASTIGTRLVIALSDDGFAYEDGQSPVQSFEERSRALRKIDGVDNVLSFSAWTEVKHYLNFLEAAVLVLPQGTIAPLGELNTNVQLIRLPHDAEAPAS